MKFLTPMTAAIALLALGACTEGDRNQASDDADRAATKTGEAVEEAGEEIIEKSKALGSAVYEGSKAAAERGSEVYKERSAELDAKDDAEDATELTPEQSDVDNEIEGDTTDY